MGYENEITHNELKKTLTRCYETKTPVFVWGTFGIGKSTVVEKFAKDHELQLIDVRVSQLEPSDLRGIPFKSTDGKTCEWLPPNWLPKDADSKGILFLDEINLAPPSIQSACYQLINQRRIGDYFLPKGWFIVCAGNRTSDKANVFDLSAPLSNRFGQHHTLKIPSVDEWVKWGTSNGNNIDSRIIAFLGLRPDALFKFDSRTKDRAIPTPRTWAFCSKLIKNVTDLAELELFVSGCVGESVGLEFTAFTKLNQKIDVKDILANPEKVKTITEIDLKYALLSGLTEVYRDKKDATNLEQIFKVSENVEPEFSILLLRLVKSVDETFFKKTTTKSAVWKRIAVKYSKYF